MAVIQQGHRVVYREAHARVDALADAQLAGTRKATLVTLTTIPLLIIDDLGMRKRSDAAAEDLAAPQQASCDRGTAGAAAHLLEHPRLWPVLPRPRMAGFQVPQNRARKASA